MYNSFVRISTTEDKAMEWMTVKETSELWGISGRRVQILCDNGKVDGAERLGNMWVIPKGTAKPIDGRTKAAMMAKTGRE
jgi:hypothetical protein